MSFPPSIPLVSSAAPRLPHVLSGTTNSSASCSSAAQVGGSSPSSQHSHFSSSTRPTLPSSLPTSPSQSVSSIPLPPIQPTGHPMKTRSKARIFKRKILLTSSTEPKTVKQALAHPTWKSAMQSKYDALMHNQTWDLVQLPPSRQAIGCK